MSHDSSLEPLLRAVEPAVRLVPERHLRQVIQFLADRGRALPSNPDLPYWFGRAELAAADVLMRDVLAGAEPRLLLVTDPNDRLIESKPRAEQLRVYWRVLFRAAVMKAVDAQLAAETLTPTLCSERLNAFGPSAAREIRYVLETEHLASPDAGDVDVYRVFAAVYLDLDHFTAHAAEEFFPALPHGPAVRQLLSAGIPVDEVAKATRPAGAADPDRDPPPDERWTAALITPPPGAEPPSTAADVPARLQRARDAESKGNFVRAAILRTQAAQAATGPAKEDAATAAVAALGLLVERLGDVLEWDTDTRREWAQALGPLLPLAASGIWPRAARCLYELQRIPADLAREVYAVDLPEAIRTLGRRPIRRHLPHARPVMVLQALHKAHKQLLRAGLGEVEQLRLDRLMHAERHRREHAIRHDFTPRMVGALTDAGLTPANRVEEVARDKVVAELLDRVCDRGFLRLGNLRDAVARNQLKLPNLRGPGEFLTGDPLLRADTNLSHALDGVYRRGEFYLRWIQRFSSLFFGTTWGRLLTLYLLLPFGGAFFVLMTLMEVRHFAEVGAAFVSKSLAAKPRPPAPLASPVPTADAPASGSPTVVWEFDEEDLEFYEQEWEWDPDENAGVFLRERVQERLDALKQLGTSSGWQDGPAAGGKAAAAKHGDKGHDDGKNKLVEWLKRAWPQIVGLGVVFLLIIHAPPFRRAAFALLALAWRGLRGLLWDLPAAVWNAPALKAARLSGTARFIRRRLLGPLLLSALGVGVFFLLGVPARWLVWWGLVAFVALAAVHNTPTGWLVQERIAEALSDWWRVVRTNLLPGLVATVLDWFRMLANWVERQLYAVDEWMRFRGGDSGGSLVLKAVLGLVWFPVAYLTRFCFYLLFEPQVNPVKHFPVVTVSHKIIAPILLALVPQVAGVVAAVRGHALDVDEGLPPEAQAVAKAQRDDAFKLAGTIYFFTQLLLPGVFGFLAWELKENWRLYARNRPERLKPVVIGSHGESMRGLLRPGFHSGTVPKVHRQTRHALAAGDRVKAARLHHELEHAAEGVHRFVERELVPLLEGSPGWGGVAVSVGAVKFGCQRAEVELHAPALGREPLVLGFENVGGVIEASVPRPGWSDKLTAAQREAFTFALRGLLDMAAVGQFDGRPRGDEPTAAEPLAARVGWAEWAGRWGGPRVPASTPAGVG